MPGSCWSATFDKGGVFASLVGTLELLEPDERAFVAGFLINKFRGDRSLLTPGLDFLTERTGIPVLGVLPFVRGLRIADEDSVSLDHRGRRGRAGRDEIEIAVVRLPRISNYDDLDPLEHEPGVVVRFVEEARELAGADLVVLPGSKSTAADLAWMRQTGIADVVVDRAGRGEPVLGLCGGCEILGREVHDPDGVESPHPFAAGLGLLPLVTRFERPKITAQVVAQSATPSFLTSGLQPAAEVRGYEIHMGASSGLRTRRRLLALSDATASPQNWRTVPSRPTGPSSGRCCTASLKTIPYGPRSSARSAADAASPTRPNRAPYRPKTPSTTA